MSATVTCIVRLTATLGVLLAASVLAMLAYRERDFSSREVVADQQIRRNRQLTVAVRQHATRAPAEPITTGRGAAPTAKRPARTNVDRGAMIRAALIRMPEYQPFLRRENRRRTLLYFGLWFDQLKVTPERLELIKTAVTERETAQQDAFEAAMSQYNPRSREFAEVWKRYVKDANQKLEATLGPDEWASFQRFEAARGWLVNQQPFVDDYLAERGITALSTEQKTALGEAYATAQKWKPDGDLPAGVAFRMRNERIATLAAPSLDPVQLAGVKGCIDFINTRSKVMTELLRPENPDAAVLVPGNGPP